MQTISWFYASKKRSFGIRSLCSLLPHVICSANLCLFPVALPQILLLHPTVSSQPLFSAFWSSPRPISNSQLHTLLYFHLCPIYLILFQGSYSLKLGYLILGGASRLDAFSVYPFRTWLLCHALGNATDTPVVRPARSSRTKASSSQISSARAG